jgi:O-antigen/teichoic acid export membrane protein
MASGAPDQGRVPRAARHVAVILVGSLIGQGLALAVSPVLSRMYTTADFGLMTVYVSVISILGTLTLFRLDAAIPLPTSDRLAAAVAWWGLGLTAVGSALIWLLQPVLAAPLGRIFQSPGLPGVWWLVALGTFFVGVDQVLLTWMVREKRYRSLGLRNGLQGVGQATAQLGLGPTSLRPTGLLIGQVVGRIAAIGGLFSAGGLLRQRRPDRALMGEAITRYRRFPLISSWSALINVLGQQAPFLVISSYYGLAVAGLVGMTVRVMATPALLIGQAVGRVFQGEASAAVRDRHTPLRPIMLSNVRTLLIIGAPVAVVIAVIGPWAFGLVFGSEWRTSGQFAQLLALGYLAQFAISPVSQTLLLLEQQGAQLAWDSMRFLLTVGGPMVAAGLGATPTVAIAVLSATWVLCYAVLFWVCLRAAATHDRGLSVADPPPPAG